MHVLCVGYQSVVTNIKLKQSQNNCRIFTLHLYSLPGHVHTHSTKLVIVITVLTLNVLTLKVFNQTHKVILFLSMECYQPVDKKCRRVVKACRETNQSTTIDAVIGLVQELKHVSSVGKRHLPLQLTLCGLTSRLFEVSGA